MFRVYKSQIFVMIKYLHQILRVIEIFRQIEANIYPVVDLDNMQGNHIFDI